MPNLVNAYDQHKFFRPHHAKIARLLVMGRSPEEIAETLGIAKETVLYLRKNSPLMKIEIRRLEREMEKGMVQTEVQADVQERIGYLAHRALDIIEENMGAPEDGMVPAAGRERMSKDAWSILDRVLPKEPGEGKINLQINLASIQQNLQNKNPEEIVAELTQRIKERAVENNGK